jgi:DNA-binding NarL/FixJ family response regulator
MLALKLSASFKEIALTLGSLPSMIRSQLQSAYQKLGVHSHIELLLTLRRSGRRASPVWIPA